MLLIENFLSDQEVGEFRAGLANSRWLDGKGTALGMAADVKRNAQADRDDPLVITLTNKLLRRMGEHPVFISACLPKQIFPPCFNRYGKGECYGTHVDAAIMRLPNSNEILRSDVSMTVFLSDPVTYEGGELEIQTGFGMQRIKGSLGSAVVYPSSSLHRVTEVTSGERVAAISWIQSLIPNAEVRANLFALDRSIQSITQLPDVSRVVLDDLHNSYHNLVRIHAAV